VNGEDEMRRLAAVGVDAIITDVTDVARRVFDA
jgi:glycerophosphoryl diester phosphodiesterase